MTSSVRVRFAPSPTGPLHIGALRTALYNFLFARKHQGSFILRIEDTDRKRFVPGSEEYILKALEWCGLTPDEGPHKDGGYGPYRQSERSEKYRAFADELIDKDHAYFAFDTPEELEDQRKEAESRGESFSYGPSTRDGLHNSIAMGMDEARHRIAEGMPYVIRFKTPAEREVHCPDLIRGDVTYQSALLDDKVLFKADGLPTYHLANVVDDHLMEISHVIRGEEWLPSLPLHILLYEAFGWTPPVFAHLPLILKPNGPGKLSKRDALKGDFPIYPLKWEESPGFRERGYLPSAVNNILALLGWSPEADREVFSLQDLAAHFSLERVHKAGARFDPDKNRWFNQQHLQSLSPSEIRGIVSQHPEAYGLPESWQDHPEYLDFTIGLVKERLELLTDLTQELRVFFEPPEEFDAKAAKKAWKEQTPDLLNGFGDRIPEDFSPEGLKSLTQVYLKEQEVGMGALMPPLRLSLVGALSGPDLFAIVHAIGRDETRRRIQKAVETL